MWFINNIDYVGKTFAVCPLPPNYEARKFSVVKHSRLAENRISFLPQMLIISGIYKYNNLEVSSDSFTR